MKLHRAWYPTDANDPNDPENVGAFSIEIPDPKKYGRVIVGVDWSERGTVEVTYLMTRE